MAHEDDDPELTQFDEENEEDYVAEDKLGPLPDRDFDQDPLPLGWQRFKDPSGRYFFVNHEQKLRSFVDPRAPTSSPHQQSPSSSEKLTQPVEYDKSAMLNFHNETGGGNSWPEDSPGTERYTQGTEHVQTSMLQEPRHLLVHPADQVWSMNGRPNAASNLASTFRTAFQGGIPAPLNSNDFSAIKLPPYDGGTVVHQIYHTTERITNTNTGSVRLELPLNPDPLGTNFDGSSDPRDTNYDTRGSVATIVATETRHSVLNNSVNGMLENKCTALYSSSRSGLSYTEQLTRAAYSSIGSRSVGQSLDISNIIESLGPKAKLLPASRQYRTGDPNCLVRFQQHVQDEVYDNEAREMEMDRLKMLITDQAREMAQQRELASRVAVDVDRSHQNNNEVLHRFQRIMSNNENLMNGYRVSQNEMMLPNLMDTGRFDSLYPTSSCMGAQSSFGRGSMIGRDLGHGGTPIYDAFGGAQVRLPEGPMVGPDFRNTSTSAHSLRSDMHDSMMDRALGREPARFDWDVMSRVMGGPVDTLGPITWQEPAAYVGPMTGREPAMYELADMSRMMSGPVGMDTWGPITWQEPSAYMGPMTGREPAIDGSVSQNEMMLPNLMDTGRSDTLYPTSSCMGAQSSIGRGSMMGRDLGTVGSMIGRDFGNTSTSISARSLRTNMHDLMVGRAWGKEPARSDLAGMSSMMGGPVGMDTCSPAYMDALLLLHREKQLNKFQPEMPSLGATWSPGQRPVTSQLANSLTQEKLSLKARLDSELNGLTQSQQSLKARLDSALQKPLSPEEFKPLKPNIGKGHTFNSLSDVVGVYGATAVSDGKKYQQLSPPMPLGAGRMSADSTRASAGSGYAAYTASRQDGREGRVISHVLEA